MNRTNHALRTGAALLITLLVGVTGCSESSGSGARSIDGDERSAKRTYPIKAVCTIGMVADIVRNVGGDHLAVTGLMGEGVDPHLYKASPGDVGLLSGADIVFYNGLNLEGRMGDMLVKLARMVPAIPVTEAIPRDLLRDPPEFLGHYDPHVWFDVSLWTFCVKQVRDELARFDPDNRAEYESNTTDYLSVLESLHRFVGDRIASIDRSRRILVTAHDAFGYFGRAFDIEVRAIQGLSTESEASVRDINDLVAFIVRRKVKAVFVETSVSEKNMQALVEGCHAAGHQITIGGQLFSDAMGRAETPEGTYVGMVRHNVNTIVKALR